MLRRQTWKFRRRSAPGLMQKQDQSAPLITKFERNQKVGRYRQGLPPVCHPGSLHHVVEVQVEAPSLKVWPQHRRPTAFALDGDGKGKWTQVGGFEIGLVADSKDRGHCARNGVLVS